MAMQFLRPASGDTEAAPDGVLKVADLPTKTRLPALFEFLTEEEWAPGTPRATGTLLIFAEEGLWKACLNDRDGVRRCFYSATTLEALLTGIDLAMRGDKLDWRKDKYPPKKKK